MELSVSKRKKVRAQARKMISQWGKELANQPTEKEKRVYLKALKKHRVDPLDHPMPKPVRGWWVG